MSYVIVNIFSNNLHEQITEVFDRRLARITELREFRVNMFRGRTKYNILGYKFGPVLTDKEIIDNFGWNDDYHQIPERGRKMANKLMSIANAILASSDGNLYLNFEDVEVLKYHNIKLGEIK